MFGLFLAPGMLTVVRQQSRYIHKREVQISPPKNNQTSKLIHWDKMQNTWVSYESQIVYHGMQSD